jgi:hypothetical protein
MNQTIRSLTLEGRESESKDSTRPLTSTRLRFRGTASATPDSRNPALLSAKVHAPLTHGVRSIGPGPSHTDTSRPMLPSKKGNASPCAELPDGKSSNSSNMSLPPFPRVLAVLLSLVTLLSGCSKSVEEQQKDLIVSIMTDGRWLVQNFAEQNTDLSAEYSGYEFQFLANGTVQGIKGASVTEGTWSASAANYTITSNFPTGDATLKRLNDTWKITNNTLRSVEARPTNNLRNAYLKLAKK